MRLDVFRWLPTYRATPISRGSLQSLTKIMNGTESVFEAKSDATQLLDFRAATENRMKSDWREIDIHVPNTPGVTALRDVPIETLVPYIDWSPFFRAWELRGRYPRILKDPTVGKEAQSLFERCPGDVGQSLLATRR